MITLDKLRELAKINFPDLHADLRMLLLAWAKSDPQGELSELLKGTGLNCEQMVDTLETLDKESVGGDQQLLTACILAVDDPPVLGIHVLKAICNSPASRITIALIKAGLNCEKLERNVAGAIPKRQGVLAGLGIEDESPASTLKKYGRDLTEEAENGRFDNLCPRPDEERALENTLLRRNKANPVLTGHAGVGKTALAERFSKRIADGDVAAHLKGARIYEIGMGRLVAGTKYRGEFEQRFENVMQAVVNNHRKDEITILFIDEFHMLMGAGKAEGTVTDGANMIKPYTARDQLRIIGATTEDEYHRYIERDPALARRFQKLPLNEPDGQLAEKMIRAQADALMKHHNVKISDSIISETIALTDRHLSHRYQPDKSVDLLDACCVNASREGRSEVGASDLLNILSAQTRRPISSLTGDDRKILRSLAAGLKTKVVGQDEQVDRVVSLLIHRRQDLGTEDRNLGSFLFCGETGTGKTSLARAINELLFRKGGSLLHIDGAEFNQASSINRLIGSAPGYEGSEKAGAMAEWIHAQGTGVVLIDEVEKADPEVIKLFLRLLDNGWINSSKGEKLDFRQCLIILTTNALKPNDLNKHGSIGFANSSNLLDPVELLSEHFPLELLGRIDEKILFNSLGDRQIRSIILMRLDEGLGRLEKRNIKVTYDKKKISDFLLKFLKQNHAGARGIERIVETKVLQPISMAMLYHEGDGLMRIRLDECFIETGKVKVLGNYK